MTSSGEQRDGLIGWLRTKLDDLAPPDGGATPIPAGPTIADLAADVARQGWEPEEVLAPGEDDAEASARRLAYVVAFAQAPADDPAFADRAVVFGILGKEQVFQRREAKRLAAELAALPPPGDAMGLTPEEIEADPLFRELETRRARLTQTQADADKVQGQIFKLMKRLVGKGGQRTGGTGPLSVTPTAEAPLGDVLAHLDDLLKAKRPK